MYRWGFDQRMSYIAITTGYNYTLRPGHITFMGRGVEDHRYLLGDITIEALRDGHMYSFEEWISSGADSGTRIVIGLIILRLDSSKSHGARHGGDGTLSFVGPENVFEIQQFFEDFVSWLGECGAGWNVRRFDGGRFRKRGCGQSYSGQSFREFIHDGPV